MLCPKCKHEVPEGLDFCDKCGAPVAPEQAARNTANATSSTAVSAKTETKKYVLLLVIAVIIIVVIIGAAIVTNGFGLLGGVDPKDSLEDYTWEELSAISDELATASDEDEAIEIAKTYNLVNEDGTLDGTQTKSVTLSDGTETSVQIAGFVHDDKSDGSGKAGITFIFTDAIAEESMNAGSDNAGGWESSEIRSWLASDGKALLPQDLQDVLVAVDKSTNNAGYIENADDVSSVTTTSDELWLFSYVELVGELDESATSYAAIYNAEGSQYKLFSDTMRQDDQYSNFIKNYQGEPFTWWERSSYPDDSYYFLYVNSDGNPLSGAPASNTHAVVPGFCI